MNDTKDLLLIPKRLFEDDSQYNEMSLEAKTLYSFMLHKMRVGKDKFTDNEGVCYINFTTVEASKLLNVSTNTVVNVMKELRRYELIKTVRVGLTQPSKIYLYELK